MNITLSKRLISLVTAFVVALTFMAVWSGAADDIPLMQFRNEKTAGLTVTKEIYRKASSPLPLRSGVEGDKTFYTENKLSEDEFRLFLLEGSSGDNVAPKQGETYTRSNKYGNYYCCVRYSGGDLSNVDLIVRPTDSSGGYEVYYYDQNGERKDYSEHVGDKSSESAYSAADMAGRFRYDYGASGTLTKNLSTGEKGEFYIYDGNDGDQVYFKKIRSSYYYITEDTALLESYNSRNIAAKLTGIYDSEVPALISGVGVQYDASDANMFEVKNVFDRPNDAFTVKKTVNYLGDTDIFDEEFSFEILVDGDPPYGYEYVKYEGDTPIEEGVFQFFGEEPIVKLRSNQRIEIKGIMKDTPIEVRELITDENGSRLNPSFSPVTVQSIEDGKTYTLVTDGARKYISWEGVYESNRVDTADFVNVPNVMLIKKNVTNPLEVENIENYGFEFRIMSDNGSGTYTELAENNQLRYYLRDGYGKPYGDSSKDGLPFVTENGRFILKNGQTAVFIGLEYGKKYTVDETRALYNGKNVSVDFKMESTTFYKTAHSETVNKAYTQSSSGELFNAKNTYDQKLGLNVSKTVEDKFGRSAPDAEYEFLLQVGTKNGDNWTFTDAENTGVKLNGEAFAAYGSVRFRLKDGETANITGLKKGTYRVVEIDPNKSTGTVYDPNPQNEEHLFITDVQVNDGSVKTENKPDPDGTAASSTSDIESEQFVLSSTSSVSVEFTNRVRELKYYFDIEKIALLDMNIHGDSGDNEQRFVFKVERFAEDQTVFAPENVLESFYVDLSCDKRMQYSGDDSITIDGAAYKHSFWHDADTDSATKSYFKYENGRTKVQKVYDSEKYQYPCSIWNGRRTVMVTKKGKYRISEVRSWSGTDYDLWKGSNRYKGYGSGISSGDSVVFSVSDVKADKFRTASAVIDSVTVYRPTASFINSESEFAYLSSQSYAENTIKRK